MSERKTYHVTPTGEGDWAVKAEGAERASNVYDSKVEAVSRAQELAKAAEPGQVVIHKNDGTIQEERTYGKDPFPPKG